MPVIFAVSICETNFAEELIRIKRTKEKTYVVVFCLHGDWHRHFRIFSGPAPDRQTAFYAAYRRHCPAEHLWLAGQSRLTSDRQELTTTGIYSGPKPGLQPIKHAD